MELQIKKKEKFTIKFQHLVFNIVTQVINLHITLKCFKRNNFM